MEGKWGFPLSVGKKLQSCSGWVPGVVQGGVAFPEFGELEAAAAGWSSKEELQIAGIAAVVVGMAFAAAE